MKTSDLFMDTLIFRENDPIDRRKYTPFCLRETEDLPIFAPSAMIGEILNLILGAGATVGYLYAWRRATAPRAGTASRMRLRLWQLLFLLGLTPYVLLVFFMMDLLARTVGSSP